MSNQITDSQFSAAEGVAEWRALFWGAKALYNTGDFATGARFVARIAEQAAALNHSPLVDLRPDTVTVTVITIGAGLTDLDLELARRISLAADDLGLISDPSAVQHVQIAFDASDVPAVMDFWRAALGYVPVGGGDMVEPNLVGPTVWFQEKAHVAPRNRIHIDVSVPHDQAEARVAAVLAAGGRMLGDKYAPESWSLIDPEATSSTSRRGRGANEGRLGGVSLSRAIAQPQAERT